MAAPAMLLELVDRFGRDLPAYRSGGFNETQTRIEFINPFFALLGWDIENRRGVTEPYKEVSHEDAIKVGGAHKAPDYGFRIGGQRRFFVEAKKPSVNIRGDNRPAFQLRRYAWSANLPLSILTDFEEFAVYDCTIKPGKDDAPRTALLHFHRFDAYPDRWDSIAEVFSKEAVLAGSLDRYAEGTATKRDRSTVDKAFLTEVESWRGALAANLARQNPHVTERQLNFAVQMTIDRVIFLRMVEDRGIEQYGRLRDLVEGSDVYSRLQELYRQADDRYNSGLFHFAKEKGRLEQPDDLTPSLVIEDETLQHMIAGLYYPNSPYEFSVLPIDVLGQVYEQFLGKVIVVDAARGVRIEEKPEVRKAGGVYYTPTYIVDFIVKHTIGNLLAGKKAGPRGGASRIRIVDPACGSGSFLIRAYQYLLDWHRDQYLEDGPEKHQQEMYQAQSGEWLLSTQEKKRILLNSIYGVDIDPQAVEVTKLSLLLKVLEGETEQSLVTQLRMFHERALPDLSRNIKCGNSLVGPNFHDRQQLQLLGPEDHYRVNAFDWIRSFPEVFASRGKGGRQGGRGGFDAVIGNPPYVYRNASEDMLKLYYLRNYQSAEGNFDLYKFFVERSLSLCRPGGYIGMIVSATFLVQPSFQRLRQILVTQSTIERLAPLGPKAFHDATVDTAILVARREDPRESHRVLIQAPMRPVELPFTSTSSARQQRFAQNDGMAFDYRLSDEGATIVRRLFERFPVVESGYEFGVGINTGFIRAELVAGHQVDGRYHPMIAGNGIARYGPVRSDEWIMYDKEYVRSRGKLGRSLPPERFFEREKLLVVRTRNLSLPRRIIATLDRTRGFNLNRLSNIIARPGHSLPGLLGILNSSLFNWLFSTRFYDYEIKPVYLRASPLADANYPALIGAVDRLLSLHGQRENKITSHEFEIVRRQIEFVDREIDHIVYDLYGLTMADQRFVETSEDRAFSRIGPVPLGLGSN
ncbi:MAG: N-6 DNA methylase [Chloroflexota bacterium]|nr:N-6 DNA methylase [Chloroflexota bacterium]